MMQQTQSIETLTFKTTPTEDLAVDIYRAPVRTQGCIAFLHGGALLLGSRKDLPKPVISFLNAKGWDVASLDYRVFPTCSVGEILSDVSDGCNFLKNRYGELPLNLVGYSAGAYLALLNGTSGTPVKGIIAFAGYGDLGAKWYYEPSAFFLSYKNVDYVAQKLESGDSFGSIEERIDLYVYLRQKGLWPEYVLGKESLDEEVPKYSPVMHLSKAFPRAVLVHGDMDCDVPFTASVDMAKELELRAIPHKLIVLSGLDHDLFGQLEDVNVVTAWDEALNFLQSR